MKKAEECDAPAGGQLTPPVIPARHDKRKPDNADQSTMADVSFGYTQQAVRKRLDVDHLESRLYDDLAGFGLHENDIAKVEV